MKARNLCVYAHLDIMPEDFGVFKMISTSIGINFFIFYVISENNLNSKEEFQLNVNFPTSQNKENNQFICICVSRKRKRSAVGSRQREKKAIKQNPNANKLPRAKKHTKAPFFAHRVK